MCCPPGRARLFSFWYTLQSPCFASPCFTSPSFDALQPPQPPHPLSLLTMGLKLVPASFNPPTITTHACRSHRDTCMQVMPGHVSIGVPTASEDTPATSFSSGTIRTTYPESTTGNTSNTLSNASSTATRLAISFHPNQRCTLTLTGGSPTSNPTAAYATSLALLARHPKFSISEKCVRGTTSVAVRFPTEVLEFIPLLNDAFRMRPPAHNDETLTSQLELGVGVRVWALLDLLACAASALHNDGSNLRKTMRGILKKSLEGNNVNALADLRLVPPPTHSTTFFNIQWQR